MKKFTLVALHSDREAILNAFSKSKLVQLAESKLKQASEDNKAYQFAQISKAEAEANAQASQALAQAKAQTDDEMQKYVANVDKAVSAILERVL